MMTRRARQNQKIQKQQIKCQAEITQKEQKPQLSQEKEKLEPAVVKPKKFIKKTIDAMKRIQRSKNQKIFLLQAFRSEENWIFTVLGFTGNQYRVTVSTQVYCTCPDYWRKRKPCKHIFFIVTRVAQNDQILNYFRSNSSKISKDAYDILDQQLTERLRGRMKGEKKETKDIDLKDDVDCAICFTEMDKENQDLDDCGTCKKYFHVICITAWMNRNPACPMCRGNFTKEAIKSSQIQGDPLSKLGRIQIEGS